MDVLRQCQRSGNRTESKAGPGYAPVTLCVAGVTAKAASGRFERPRSLGLVVESGNKGEAPRGEHSTNQLIYELGAWHIRHLRQRRVLQFYPWTAPEQLPKRSPKQAVVKHNPLARARFYQSLIDSGVVKNRAELALHLGVSRARVTQVLKRLTR